MLDLFCGAGVGASGIQLAGYNLVFAVDNKTYAVTTYNRNIGNHAVCQDTRKIAVSDLPPHDLMIATPVCKSFSVSGGGKGFDHKEY